MCVDVCLINRQDRCQLREHLKVQRVATISEQAGHRRMHVQMKSTRYSPHTRSGNRNSASEMPPNHTLTQEFRVNINTDPHSLKPPLALTVTITRHSPHSQILFNLT